MKLVHGLRQRKLHGIHYTPRILADQLAVQMMEYVPRTAGVLKLVDPAVGDGELLCSLVRVCLKRGVTPQAEGFDTDNEAVGAAEAHLRTLLPRDHVRVSRLNFLDQAVIPGTRTLFSENELVGSADLVIANPPYIRTQVLGADRAQDIAQKFDLSGRVDIYQAFIKAISWTLCDGGVAGLIIPNRFMTVRAGTDIRSFILTHFDVLEVWDLGDTRLFEAAVLPSVLILRRNDAPSKASNAVFKSVYRSTVSEIEPTREVENVCDSLAEPGYAVTKARDVLHVRHGTLDHGSSPTGVWRISTEESTDWLDTVMEHTFCRFRDVGKVRVGVKSTADSVYLKQDWSDEIPELLRPVTTHHVARSFRAKEITRRILYPHTFQDGKRGTVNLDHYPISKRYLEKHRGQLERRTYVMSSGRKWFELWVPQSPEMWALPKVVFRDIAEKPTFWMDMDGTVVNGDCYWIAQDSADSEMLWLLLAVANSRFIEDFYDHRFNNRLYAGRRRFMTQYVETFPLPDPGTALSRSMIQMTKLIYEGIAAGREMVFERELLERDVYLSFGLEHPERSISSAGESEVCDSAPFPQIA